MDHSPAARAAARRPRKFVVVGLVLVLAAVVGILGCQLVWPSATSFGDAVRGPHDDAQGEADGVVPQGASVFDGEFAAVAKLDPSLLRAIRRAATDAAEDGVEFELNSGWRSAAYQERLLREAVAQYGSPEEAARWVATAKTSAHVSGDAVDIGPSDAAAWLSEHGAHYGLCRIYRNEPWHFELRPEATGQGCPVLYPDPTHDPRMQS
jgi:hypothetical protein